MKQNIHIKLLSSFCFLFFVNACTAHQGGTGEMASDEEASRTEASSSEAQGAMGFQNTDVAEAPMGQPSQPVASELKKTCQETAIKHMEAMYAATREGDVDGVLSRTYDIWSKIGLTEDMMREKLKEQLSLVQEIMKNAIFKMTPPEQVLRVGEEIQTVVVSDSVMTIDEQEVRQASYNIGFSQDDCQTWKFLRVPQQGKSFVFQIAPNVAADLDFESATTPVLEPSSAPEPKSEEPTSKE